MSLPPDPDGMYHRPARPGRKKPAAPLISAETFREQFNETLADILDLAKWRAARDPGEEYRRIEQEVQNAVEGETDTQKYIRDEIHPMIAESPTAPPGAGRHEVTAAEVLDAQRGLLFNGAVEACDGTNQDHDSLALTIHQIAVSLVSYRGDQDSWQMRLFRRDVRLRNPDPVDAVMELLEKRAQRKAGLHASSRDPLSELARRGLMTYAERAVLARRSAAPWRMGHGSPAPLELIGAKFTDLTIESIKVIRELIDHGRFVFVASEPADRALLAIGQGLRPLEYAVIGALPERLAPAIEDWAPTHPATVSTEWDGAPLGPRGWVRRFLDEAAPKVVYGLYRAAVLAPPQLFYAHVDHAAVAARIALADSVLLEQRGFPLLIDLADRVCRSVYGGGLREMAQTAYAAAGAPFRYQSERATREDPVVGPRVPTVFAALAAELPVSQLPRSTEAHTRHYMPGRADHRTLVFDRFVSVPRSGLPNRRAEADGELLIQWPGAELSADRRTALAHLLEGLAYLGRAESWCKARLLPEPATVRPNCKPLPSGGGVQLLAPDPKRWSAWDYGPKVRRPDPAWNLLAETVDVQQPGPRQQLRSRTLSGK